MFENAVLFLLFRLLLKAIIGPSEYFSQALRLYKSGFRSQNVCRNSPWQLEAAVM